MKKLWLITRTDDCDSSWDIYLGAVVCAETSDDAKLIHPNGDVDWDEDKYRSGDVWIFPKEVKVEYLGIADDTIKLNSVICSDFKAG